MVMRGVADAEMSKLASQGQPRALRRLSRPLDSALARRLGFPGEDDDLEMVVGALAEAGVIPREGPAERARPVPPAQLPAGFRKVLRYTCQSLAVQEPPVMMVDPGGAPRMADLRPSVLLVPPDLADSSDTVELGFRLARALASSKPGRTAGVARSGRQLRPYFVALLALARGADTVPDPEANQVLQRIVAAPAGFKLVALEVAGRLQRGRKAVDLSGWIRALARTADRTGLLISGDLVRVGQAVAQDGGAGAIDDLLAFALSPEHMELREELGLSAAG
jgi:hypothetical protein